MTTASLSGWPKSVGHQLPYIYARHRDRDLPAIEYANGDKEWWFYGKRHRDNGPAVIIGDKQYWFKYGEFIKCIL